MKIATLTMNPAIDKSSAVNQVVAEWKLRCEPPAYEPGGGGINVSRAIRKLGGDSVALYPAGGLAGQMLSDLLYGEGLQHQPMSIAGVTRENFTVLEKSTGQQYRFGMPGPTLTEAELRRCLEELSGLLPQADYLVASGRLPPGVPANFYGQLARLARENKTRLIVDTSGEALRLAVAEGVFLIKPNLREFAELTGRERVDEQEEERLARELVSTGQSETVVVSLGAAGVLVASAEGAERVRAPLVPIKSKVGAGDSTVAGIVLALARGRSWREAVRYGVAAGAAAVMTPGTELCRREDVERLYEQLRLTGDYLRNTTLSGIRR
ncbi:MAG: phosphofructokinase [Deltaproteobacteria bacterium CG07_land_8_20_14_0_80_60_11]|nr:MAG: phosphofructokinase [Deltaproteobacteria bacterium CG07_land_8_20_14_0_80_60_11]